MTGGDEVFVVGRDRSGARVSMRLRDMTWSDVICALAWLEDVEPDSASAERLRELVGEMLPPKWGSNLRENVRRFWRGAQEGRYRRRSA